MLRGSHRYGVVCVCTSTRGESSYRRGARRRGPRPWSTRRADSGGLRIITVAERRIVTELAAGLRRSLSPVWRSGRLSTGAALIVRINMSPADFKMGDLVSSLNAVCARTTSPATACALRSPNTPSWMSRSGIAKILKSFRRSARDRPDTSARASRR